MGCGRIKILSITLFALLPIGILEPLSAEAPTEVFTTTATDGTHVAILGDKDYASIGLVLTAQDIESLLQQGANPSIFHTDAPSVTSSMATDPPASTPSTRRDVKLSFLKKPLFQSLIADPYGPSVQFSLFMVTQREIDQSNRVEFRPGYELTFVRLHPEDNPNLGLDLFFYFTLPMRMTADRFRMISLDGIFAVGLGLRPTDWLALRLYRHHFSSHAGDELKDLNQSQIDYDSSMSSLNALYLRDEWGFSLAIEPLNLFKDIPKEFYLRLYGEAFLATRGEDLFGPMYFVPAEDSPWWFQWGVEGAYSFDSPRYGGLFGALNVSYFQESGFTPNTSLLLGYQLPYSRDISTAIALNWYRGRARDNTFYTRHENMWGMSLRLNM